LEGGPQDRLSNVPAPVARALREAGAGPADRSPPTQSPAASARRTPREPARRLGVPRGDGDDCSPSESAQRQIRQSGTRTASDGLAPRVYRSIRRIRCAGARAALSTSADVAGLSRRAGPSGKRTERRRRCSR
jgi:hypothetical protein